jgi:hypothetical protein
MDWSPTKTIINLLALGVLLTIFRIVYMFFDPYGILDLVVFLSAGLAVGRKVASNRWLWGLLLSLPAFAFSLFLVMRIGYSSIVHGVGTLYAVSLIVIPVASCVGIAISAKRAYR